MSDYPRRGVVAAAVVLAGLSGFALAGLWATTGQPWFRDGEGNPLGLDFMAFRAIGFAVFEGRVEDAYDHDAFSEMLAAIGIRPGLVELYWLNPPHFALLVAPFALLPLNAAFLAFVLGTALLFAATFRLSVPSLPWAVAVVFALASPAAYAVVVKGQNGFLTAALLGAGLLLLDRRPIAAGICIGLLSVKPQLGILLPALLLLGRHWVAIVSAVVTVAACMAISAALLGPGSWVAFARSLGAAGDHYLTQGAALTSMHSVYATLVPQFGRPSAALLHAAVLAIGFAMVIPLWRRAAAPELRNAATLGLVFLATPYVFSHDVPMLVLGAAILAWGRPSGGLPLGSAALLAVLALVTPLPLAPAYGAPGAVLAAALVVFSFLEARRTEGPIGARRYGPWGGELRLEGRPPARNGAQTGKGPTARHYRGFPGWPADPAIQR